MPVGGDDHHRALSRLKLPQLQELLHRARPEAARVGVPAPRQLLTLRGTDARGARPLVRLPAKPQGSLLRYLIRGLDLLEGLPQPENPRAPRLYRLC